MPGIPVFIYHAIEDSAHPAGTRNPGEQLYVLSVSQFREQMEYLHREGYKTYLLEELQTLTEWPDKAVVLTFDDGHESNFTLALPILQEFSFKADFYITTGWIGTPCFMTEEQIKALSDAGMGIGSHGVTHTFLSDLPTVDARKELDISRVILTGILQRQIRSFSAPGGRICSRVADLALACGYTTICTSRPGLMTENEAFSDIPRFAVRAADTFFNYTLILRQDPQLLRSIAQRTSILKFAKIILGNYCYEKIRGILISG